MDEEHTKTRRSSTILKPQKPRNPLGDLDFGNGDPQEANTLATKRVSFASSRNVRQFVADPEKNTIWDDTYEENINKSDNSGQSQIDDADSITRNQLNTTKYWRDSSADLDFTNIVQSTLNNEVQVHKSIVCTSMDFTQPLLNVNATSSSMKCQSMHFNTTSKSSMDFTCASTEIMQHAANFCENDNVNVNRRESTMELTQPLPNVNPTGSSMKNQTMHFNTTSKGLMDFTCASTEIMQNAANFCENNFNVNRRESTMEFTKCIPFLKKETNETQNCIEDIMDFTRVTYTGCNMNRTEYTKELSLQMSDTNKENVSLGQRGISKTIELSTNTLPFLNEHSDMDITPSILQENVLIYNSSTVANNIKSPQIENAKIELSKTESKELNYNRHISVIDRCDETEENSPDAEFRSDGKDNLNLPQKLIHVNKIQTTNFNISELLKENESKQLLSNIIADMGTPQENLLGCDKMAVGGSEENKIADCLSFVACNCDESENNCNVTSSQTSSFKTAHSSFHTDVTNDDTQDLINYPFVTGRRPKSNFSKIVDGDFNPSPMNSQFMILTDSIHVSLNMDENDQIKSSDNNSNAQEMNREISNSGHATAVNEIDVQSISYINESDAEQSNVLHKVSETTNISQEEMTLCDSFSTDRSMNLEEKHKEQIANFKKNSNPSICRYLDKLVIPNFSSVAIVSNNVDTKPSNKKKEYNKYLKELIDRKLNTFKTTYRKRDIEEVIQCGSNSSKFEDRNLETKSNLNDVKLESMKNKVKEQHNGCDGYWNILFLENGVYTFDTLLGTLQFTVYLDEANGMVSTIDVDADHIGASCEPIKLYVHRNFSQQLSLKCIQSALGGEFHILSLLDYVHMIMQKMIDVEKDFWDLSCTYSVVMDEYFRINFTVANANSLLQFLINALDLNNICDETITYSVIVGNIKDSYIKQCIVESPKGFSFIRNFIEKVYQLLEHLEMKKLKKYPNPGKQ